MMINDDGKHTHILYENKNRGTTETYKAKYLKVSTLQNIYKNYFFPQQNMENIINLSNV